MLGVAPRSPVAARLPVAGPREWHPNQVGFLPCQHPPMVYWGSRYPRSKIVAEQELARPRGLPIAAERELARPRHRAVVEMHPRHRAAAAVPMHYRQNPPYRLDSIHLASPAVALEAANLTHHRTSGICTFVFARTAEEQNGPEKDNDRYYQTSNDQDTRWHWKSCKNYERKFLCHVVHPSESYERLLFSFTAHGYPQRIPLHCDTVRLNTTSIAIQNAPQHCQSVEYRHL